VRTEDIVGCSFFALLIPAVIVTISGSRTSLSIRQRALRRGWGLTVISCVLLGFGLLNFELIHRSPRQVVEGNLWDIRELSSRRAHLTRFMITDATGHAVQVWCNYTGPGLVEGDRARVRYVAYNGKVLELDMLTGSFQMWHLRESSGEWGWWWWIAIGLVCGFFAYRQMATIGQQETKAL
jgi:hypothetical protein